MSILVFQLVSFHTTVGSFKDLGLKMSLKPMNLLRGSGGVGLVRLGAFSIVRSFVGRFGLGRFNFRYYNAGVWDTPDGLLGSKMVSNAGS